MDSNTGTMRSDHLVAQIMVEDSSMGGSSRMASKKTQNSSAGHRNLPPAALRSFRPHERGGGGEQGLLVKSKASKCLYSIVCAIPEAGSGWASLAAGPSLHTSGDPWECLRLPHFEMP